MIFDFLAIGNRKWFWDFATRTQKERSWPAVGNCTAALRWLERYYCFQGNKFLRFNPVTGEVPPRYPLDARDYFISCPGRGKKAPTPGIYWNLSVLTEFAGFI